MKLVQCPRCKGENYSRSGVVKQRQRYYCKDCHYYFTVQKEGKKIDPYYVVKALQLYIEGVTFREIERILGVSHVSIINWVKQYNIRRPELMYYHPTYKVLTHNELLQTMQDKAFVKSAGFMITELGDKYMLIRWERFRP